MRFVIRSDENPTHEYYVLKSKVIVPGAHQPTQMQLQPSSHRKVPTDNSITTTTTTNTNNNQQSSSPPSSSSSSSSTHNGHLSNIKSGGSKLALFFEEASHSKLLHDEKLRQMMHANVIIEHDLGNGQTIMFIRTDAHLLMDVTQSAWFKMIQRRFNLEFVQYLDVFPLQDFWDAEFRWAAAKLGCKKLLPVEKRESHARVKMPQNQQQQQQMKPAVVVGLGSDGVGNDTAATKIKESVPKFVPASTQQLQKILVSNAQIQSEFNIIDNNNENKSVTNENNNENKVNNDNNLDRDFFPNTVVLPSSAVPTPSYYLQQQHQQISPAKLQQVLTLVISRSQTTDERLDSGGGGGDGGNESRSVSREEEAMNASAATERGDAQQQQQQHNQKGLPTLAHICGEVCEGNAQASGVVLPSPQMHPASKSDISYLCNESDDDSLFVVPTGNDDGCTSDGNSASDKKRVASDDDDLGLLLPPFKVFVQNNIN